MAKSSDLKESYFMGIDIGTQGVRSLIVSDKGEKIAGCSYSFPQLNTSTEPGFVSQSPQMWWQVSQQVIRETLQKFHQAGFSGEQLSALCIDGTSGTILAVDGQGNPLGDAIMYNDSRALEETTQLREYAQSHEAKYGFRFNSSFALPKILWLKNHAPQTYENCRYFIHQSDYVAAKLSGEWGVSDFSNALKTGYDPLDNQWPDFFSPLGLDRKKFPQIVSPGTAYAFTESPEALELGLSPQTRMVSGATDGYASALAAGAVKTGRWASILGTTLVLKGVSSQIIIDPQGSSYCHLLPDKTWLTGGASNVGGLCLHQDFAPDQFSFLDQRALALAPTGVISYPLTGIGERYPFVSPKAQGFIEGDISNPQIHYTALLEGVAFVEKLAYEKSQASGCQIGSSLYSAGGASRSLPWLKIRASILDKELQVPAIVDATMGSALLAATGTYYSDLSEAADRMIRIEQKIQPRKEWVPQYQEIYAQFKQACEKNFAINL